VKQVVILLIWGAAAGRLPAGEILRLEQSLDAMGSVYTIVAYGEDRSKMLAAADEAFEEVRRLDRMLSNYRADSELSRLNRAAAEAPVPVSEELFTLLSNCLRYSRESEGAFDITVGPLMKIWGFYKGSGRLPHRAEIRGILGRIGYQHVVLDAATRTVHFQRNGMSLDPGGIGKGYAVDRMVDILRTSGIRSALISAGNSTIYALGKPPNDPGWKISLRHPRDITRQIEEIRLQDMSMSTSGTSEKFFRAEGKLYSHIMDPRTGYPAQGMLSVSVIAPKALDSEAWTKPVFINGRSWTAKHLSGNPAKKDFRFYLCTDKQGSEPCAWLQ
jgi:thiamine biosynthesis lipoprotein